jgi:hypothetical protein
VNAAGLAWAVLRGDRRTRTSSILIGVGVAVASTLVLLLVSLPSAAQARADRAAWQTPEYLSPDQGQPAMLMSSTLDYTGGDEITRVDVASTGAGEITLPPGVDRLPGPGEVLVSPELADRMDRLPGSALGDRFGGQVVGLLGQDALLAPEQLVALVGHEASAMPSDAAPTAGFATAPGRVDGTLGLLAGVGVVVLLVPSLVLVASASRLIAARRERRLAALRLAGASPAQIVRMVAVETAIAATAGALFGLAVNPLVHRLATVVPWEGGTWQPGDFALPVPTSLAIVIALPVLVVLAAVLGLRRVVSTPLGATAEHGRKPLHWTRLLALPAAGLFFFTAILGAQEGGDLSVLMLFLGLGLLVGSAAVVGPWVTSAVGGVFVRRWRRPAGLLAGRRLRDDPRGAYRASAGVVLAVFTGSMALTLLPSFESMAGGGRSFEDSVLYVETSGERAGELVAQANAELARYGQAERATAIGEVTVLQDLGGASTSSRQAMVMDCATADRLTRLELGGVCAGDPAIYTPLSMDAAGLSASGSYDAEGTAFAPDTPVRPIAAADSDVTDTIIVDPAVLPEGVTPQEVTVAVPTTEANREVVRTALVGAAPGEQVLSRELHLADQQQQLADLRRVTVIGLTIAAALAGCSAAIATAGSVMDRRRTFGTLIAAGTPVRVLARALRTEAALPALVATIGAGAVGVFAGLGLFSLLAGGDDAPVLSPWILAPVVLGALVAVLAASVCRPALNHVAAEPLSEE